MNRISRNRALRSSAPILITMIISSTVVAEFRCSSEVVYKWRKDPGTEAPKEDEKEADAHAVFWSRLERAGATQDEAKGKLESYLPQEKMGAADQCRRDHADLTGCVASRFNALHQTLSTMSFAARKILEESIDTECKSRQGTCLGAESSEIVCKEIVTAAPPEEAAGKDKKDEGKEKSKDKKKK